MVNKFIIQLTLYLKKNLSGPFIKKLIGGIFTQGLLSITSLIIGLSIARQAAKEEYGIYAIAFSTIMIAASIQNALVNSPLTVLLPEKDKKTQKILLSGLAIGQWLIFSPILLLFGCLLLSIRFYLGYSPLLQALFILIITIPALFFRDFVRVVNYCYLKIKRIILMDLVFTLLAILGIIILSISNQVDSSNALFILGIAYLISAIFGHYIAKVKYKFNIVWIKKIFKETWKISQWALFGIIAANIRQYGYVYIISIVLTLSDTADLAASRLFLMPFGIFISSSQRILLSKGAKIRADNDYIKLGKFLLFFVLLFFGIWCIWVAILYLLNDYLIKAILTFKYDNVNYYLLIWSIIFLLSAVSFIVSNALQVLKEFKKLAICGHLSAWSLVFFCIILSKMIGGNGAIISLGIAELVFMMFGIPILIKSIKKQ